MFWCFLLGYLVAKASSDTGEPLGGPDSSLLNLSNAFVILPSNDTASSNKAALLVVITQPGANDSRVNEDNSTPSGERLRILEAQTSQLTLQDARKRRSVGDESSLIPLKREKRTFKKKGGGGGCMICGMVPQMVRTVMVPVSSCGQPQCGQPVYHPPPQPTCNPCQQVYRPPPQPACNVCQMMWGKK